MGDNADVPNPISAFVRSPSLKRYAWLSIGAALVTIALKAAAWKLTGSVGLLSDALESLVNLAGAIMALAMLTVAAMPADEDHAYGHGKAEYFSSAFEGGLILLAAISIAWAAVERLIKPAPIEAIGLGVAISIVASLINLAVARVLLGVGKRYRSITLEADAHHLMTDVWTSAGVLVGVGLAWYSGLTWLDPAVALLVAANIVWTGIVLLRRSAAGLMDAAITRRERKAVEAALDAFKADGIAYHALRTRQSGSRAFVSVHLLVPGAWTVQHGHDWAEKVEDAIRAALPHAHVTTHLEPKEDPKSLADGNLER